MKSAGNEIRSIFSSHSGQQLPSQCFNFSGYLVFTKYIGILTSMLAVMEIPQGNTREDNKTRRTIIKDFYTHWILEHPEKKVWNKSLRAYIFVKNGSINEALGHAPRSVEATIAQMHLSEILSSAVLIERRPTKYGDKNQKRFSQMLFLKWKSSRVLVGQRKTSGEYELKSRQVTALKTGLGPNIWEGCHPFKRIPLRRILLQS